MLKLAGCRLLIEGRTLIVLDSAGQELERGTRGRWEWLCAASAAMLVERWADALGLRHELHLKHLQMRLWRPGDDPEAAPWLPFAAALGWLAEVEATRAAQKAQRAAAEVRRWLAQFVRRLGALLQGVRRSRGRVRRQGAQVVGRVGELGLIERGSVAVWGWAPEQGPPGWSGSGW
jgi:hypothetical protein